MAVFAQPADTYVAAFIGAPSMNLLAGTLARNGTAAQLATGLLVPLADGRRTLPDGTALTIGIRPEHLLPAAEGLSGQVDLVERLGSESVAHLRLEDGTPLAVKLAGAAPVPDRLTVAPMPEHIHVFEAASGKRLPPGGRAAVPTPLEATGTAV
jgi:ABC-type sugar transport system ATPase subunit